MTERYTSPFPEVGERVEARCHRCKSLLSRVVTRLPPSEPFGLTDDEPLLPAGLFAPSEQAIGTREEFFGTQPGEVLMNIDDLPHTKPGGKRKGCCGPDGMDGPNLFCPHGHKVGTELGDCWMPHFVRLSLKWVELCSPELGVQD